MVGAGAGYVGVLETQQVVIDVEYQLTAVPVLQRGSGGDLERVVGRVPADGLEGVRLVLVHEGRISKAAIGAVVSKLVAAEVADGQR